MRREGSDMSDRIEEILTDQITSFRRSVDLMNAGKFFTSANGVDTTAESIAQYLEWIRQLEEVLRRHAHRKAILSGYRENE